MSLLTTLALVVIPLVKATKRDAREAKLERQLEEVKAERDLWRTECLAVRQRLTEQTIENIHLGQQLDYAKRALSPPEVHGPQYPWRYAWIRPHPATIDWAECTCTPDRAEALKRGE